MIDRLAQVRGQVEPVMTGLARGYEGNKFIFQSLFPIVEVPGRVLKVPFFGKELFRINKALRAPRAQSNRMAIDFRSVESYELEEWDLFDEIDYAEVEESLQDEKAYSTLKVQEGITLGIEAECAEMAQNSSNYPAGHAVALSGTDQFTDYTNSDPRAVAKEGHEAIRKSIGKRPNTLVLGSKTLEALEDHPKLIDKIKYTQAGFPDTELLKKYFKVDEVVVGESIYWDPVAEEFVDLWGDVFILAYVDKTPVLQQRNRKVLSFGYTFRKKSYPKVDSFETNPNKVLAIRNTDIIEPLMVGNDCGYLVTNTCADA